MLECKDLMIGDWVKVHFGEPNETIGNDMYGPVAELYDDGRIEVAFKDSPSVLWNIEKERGDEILPIPLTPEILEKNVIKLFSTYTHPYRDGEWEEGELEEERKKYPMYVYQTLDPYIVFVARPNEQELKVYSSNYKTKVEKKEEVIFVHELQHALRLCGIKKEIVL